MQCKGGSKGDTSKPWEDTVNTWHSKHMRFFPVEARGVSLPSNAFLYLDWFCCDFYRFGLQSLACPVCSSSSLSTRGQPSPCFHGDEGGAELPGKLASTCSWPRNAEAEPIPLTCSSSGTPWSVSAQKLSGETDRGDLHTRGGPTSQATVVWLTLDVNLCEERN